MNLFKRIIAAALLCCSLLTYTACREDDGSGGTFKYDISYNPGSLDPQTSTCAEPSTICCITWESSFSPILP